MAIAVAPLADAPIVIELEHCASYMEDTYDFLKPLEARSPFPVVANHRSIQCYLRALDVCQATLRRKLGLGRITDWAPRGLPSTPAVDFFFCNYVPVVDFFCIYVPVVYFICIYG